MKYNGTLAQEQSLIFLAGVPKCVQAGVSPLGAVRQACSCKLASLPVYATCFGSFTTRKSSRNAHKSSHEAIVRFLCALWIIESPQELVLGFLGGALSLYSIVLSLYRNANVQYAIALTIVIRRMLSVTTTVSYLVKTRRIV